MCSYPSGLLLFVGQSRKLSLSYTVTDALVCLVYSQVVQVPFQVKHPEADKLRHSGVRDQDNPPHVLPWTNKTPEEVVRRTKKAGIYRTITKHLSVRPEKTRPVP